MKDHKQLKEIAEHNPDNEDIFEDNLINNFYPQRPQELEDVCLYDFTSNVMKLMNAHVISNHFACLSVV